MVKTVFVLPNRTEISSGINTINAISNCTITETVNSEEDLYPGSVCASMVEATIISPGGTISIPAGTEITVYRDTDGIREKIGIFAAEKPSRSSANSYKITAYDRIVKLDKDLTDWLSRLTAWPYSLADFANAVCQECGLNFATDTFPNSNYQIPKFIASGITGRRLMTWVGQIATRYVYADQNGNIVLGWYHETTKVLAPSGDNYIFQGSLQYEDYAVSKIDKVQIQLSEDDVGVIYPPTSAGDNVLKITENFLLTAVEPTQLLPIAQSIYDVVKNVSYTPCRVSTLVASDIHSGDIIRIQDANGKIITTYIMSAVSAGQRCTLESTGNFRRKVEHTAMDEKFGALNAKMLEIVKGLDGLKIKASETETIVQNIGQQTESNSAGLQDYQQYKKEIASQLELLANELDLKFTQSTEHIESVNGDLQSQYNEISKLIRATIEGIFIGQSDSDTQLHLDNDIIEILVSSIAEVVIDRSGLRSEQVTVRTIHQGAFTWTVSGPNNNILTLS